MFSYYLITPINGSILAFAGEAGDNRFDLHRFLRLALVAGGSKSRSVSSWLILVRRLTRDSPSKMATVFLPCRQRRICIVLSPPIVPLWLKFILILSYPAQSLRSAQQLSLRGRQKACSFLAVNGFICYFSVPGRHSCILPCRLSSPNFDLRRLTVSCGSFGESGGSKSSLRVHRYR